MIRALYYLICQAQLEPEGIPFMWVDIPQGKRLVSIDTSKTPHVPVFEDILPTEFEVLSEKVDTKQLT